MVRLSALSVLGSPVRLCRTLACLALSAAAVAPAAAQPADAAAGTAPRSPAGLHAPSARWQRLPSPTVGRQVAPAGTPSASSSAAAASTCPVPAPTTAAGWQAGFDALNDDTWSGADQGSSLRLPDGRVLWVFDDTFQGAQAPDGSRAAGTRVVRNSLVLSDRGCLRGVTGPGGAEVLPGTAGQWYWPLHAFLDGGRLFLSASRVAQDATGAFVTSGTWLAELSLPAGGTPTFRALSRTPSSGTPETTAQWGTAIAQAGGWTYVYGTQRVDQPYVFGKALYVARVPAGKVTALSAWRFWNGRGWVAGAAQARAIRPAVGGVSTSLSVWRAAPGSWRAVTKKDDWLGSQVVLLRAPSPTGPWTETVLASSPSYARPGETTYNAFAHPGLALSGGALLVSVSRNNDDFGAHLRDADLYKPQFTSSPVR